MNKLKWTTDNIIEIDKYKIPINSSLKISENQNFIRDSLDVILVLKKLLWPIFKLISDLCVDGFIEKGIGRWIKESSNKNSIFLDIGCGNTKLHRYIPSNFCYNAFDLSFSKFHLLRALKKKNANIAIASAKDIPLKSNTVTIVASTECFQHINKFDQVIKEVHRVLKPGGVLVCTNSNPYSHKYKKKGPHIGIYNMWSNEEFIDIMKANKFVLIENYMKGYWIPFPRWITKISFQIPISSKDEYMNTCFFYKFKTI